MNLAGYQLDIIHAGFLRLDGGAMFGIVPKPLWERRIPADDKNRILLAMRCLLLRGHGRTILVDNGVGDKYTEKFGEIYGVDVEEHSLLTSLESTGVHPDEVTDVVLTHLHFDHAGGSTTRNEEGKLELVCQNATHHIQKSHWEWAKESPREQASFLPENIDPIGKSGRLNLLEGEETPFPNISMIVVNGHTRGQQLPLIRGENETLLYAADLLPTTAHIPLLWIMAYDVEPLETLEEKTRVLQRAAQGNWRIFFEHDPEIATGRIEATERGYGVVNEHQAL
ncbi:MAG: MBL fold metallo-hydrolase [Rubricoccaceae bacterium]|nr:MBL fold metallo-hydrolase [Rubricoccaceae bacterium]